MKLIEVDTDSNGVSIIELSRLENDKYKVIVDLMLNKDVYNLVYISRVEAGAEIKWFDDKSNSIGILIRTSNYINFLNHLESKFK